VLDSSPRPFQPHLADSTTSAEVALVLCCCRNAINPSEPISVAHILNQPIDWQRVFAIAANHYLIPLLHTQLQQFCSQQVPTWVTQTLKGQFQANMQQNLVLTAELIKVTRCLKDEKITAIALKGSTLAQLAYRNLALRQFLDIDLWIPKPQLFRACQTLVRLGYQPQFELTPFQQKRYLNIRDALSFWNPTAQIQIDLHGSLLPRQFSFAPAIEHIRYEAVPFANETRLTLAKPYLLRYLCWHGAKHNWSHLSWVCDIAALLHRYPDVAELALELPSGRIGTDTMVFLGLYLAQHLTGVAIPAAIAAQLHANPHIPKIAAQVQQNFWLDAHHRPHHIEHDNTIYLQAMDSWRDRWFFRWDQICTPTPLEWQLVALPPWLYPLYYVLRPLRLLLKYTMLRLRRDQV
jgi:hypothetical protein